MSEDLETLVLEAPVDTVRSILSNGVVDLKDLKRRTGMSVTQLRILCQQHNIPVPAHIALYKPRGGLAECVDERFTLQKIGEHFNVKREQARQWLLQAGLYTVWKARRREPRQKISTQKLQEFACLLSDYLDMRLREESWATRKTVEYVQIRPRTHYSEAQLLKLFFVYAVAKKENRKLSLQELAERCDIDPPQISVILDIVNVHPMYRKVERQYISQERKDVIRKCFGLRISTPDIAYLLGEKVHVVAEVFRQMGGRQKQKNFQLPQKLTVRYRDASLIYLGQDMGLIVKEIAKDLDKKPRLIRYVLEKRNEIAPKIVEVLKAKDPNVETPYL